MKYFILVRHGRQISEDFNADTDLSDKGIQEVSWLIDQLKPTIEGLSVTTLTGQLLRHQQTGSMLQVAFGGNCASQWIDRATVLESLESFATEVVILVHSENTINTLRENFTTAHLRLPQPKHKEIAWGEATVFDCLTKEETLIRRY